MKWATGEGHGRFPLHYVPCRYEERTGRSDEGGDDEERDGTGRVSVSSRLLRLRLTIRDECNEVRRKTVGMWRLVPSHSLGSGSVRLAASFPPPKEMMMWWWYALQRHRVRRSERAEGMRWGTSRETDPPNQDLTFLSPVGCGRDRNEWRERSVPSYIPFSFRSGMRREGLERNGCDKTLAIPFHSSWPEGPPDEECNDEEGTTSEWTTWVKLVGWEGPVSGEGRVEGNQEWIMNGGSFRRSESRVVPSPHPFHHRLRRWWKGWGRREPATDDEPLPTPHPHSVRPFLTVTTVPSWVFLRDRNRAAWLVGDENGCPREPLHSATRLTQQRNKEIMWDAGRFPPLLPRSANRVSREQEEHGRDFITRPTTHYKPMKSLPTSCPSCRFSLRSSLPSGAYMIIS